MFRRKKPSQTESRDSDSIGDTSDLSASHQQMPTNGLISLILTEDDLHIKKKLNSGKYDKPSMSDSAQLAAVLYCIIVTLFGFLFPLSEALQNQWLQSWYTGVFIFYIYLVGTLFLIYLQAFLIHEPSEEADTGSELGEINTTAAAQAFDPGTGKAAEAADIASVRSLDSSFVSNFGAASTASDQHKQRLKKISAVSYSPSISFAPDPGRSSPAGGLNPAEKTAGRKLGMSSMKSKPELLAGDGGIAAAMTVPNGPNTTSDRQKKSSSGMQLAVPTSGGGVPETEINSKPSKVRHESSKSAFSAVSSASKADKAQSTPVNQPRAFVITLANLRKLFSHEGSSFYLRIGALVFSIGNIIYIILEIIYHLDGSLNTECYSYNFGWTYIFRLIFIVAQTFVIFKNPKVHVHRQKPVAYLGFSHIIATNLCVWMRTLINEIVYEMEHSNQPHIIATEADSTNVTCNHDRSLLMTASPYLFPLVMEYSLIALGTFAMMYSELGESKQFGFLRNIRHVVGMQKRQSVDFQHTIALQNKLTRGDTVNMRHAEVGTLVGVIMMAAMIAAVIVFFFIDTTDHLTSFLIYSITDITMHSLLLLACVIALYQINQLSATSKPVSVDDLLLLFSMSGAVLFEFSIVIAEGNYMEKHGSSYTSALSLSDSLISGTQAIIQVVLLVSGIRRYSSRTSHIVDMPGRQALTFLIIGNVTVWIYRTMQVKQLALGVPADFYGQLAWLLLLNINLPLLLFYRFHASVCCADIWTMAYKSIQEQLQYSYTEEEVEDAKSPWLLDSGYNSDHGEKRLENVALSQGLDQAQL